MAKTETKKTSLDFNFGKADKIDLSQLGDNSLIYFTGDPNNTNKVFGTDSQGNFVLKNEQAESKQDKVSALGATTVPVYISATGVFSQCASYAGGTKLTVNGLDCGASGVSILSATSYSATSNNVTYYLIGSNSTSGLASQFYNTGCYIKNGYIYSNSRPLYSVTANPTGASTLLQSISIDNTNYKLATKTSDLTNDSDFITQDDVPTDLSALNDDEEHRLVTDDQIQYWNGKQDLIAQYMQSASVSGDTLTLTDNSGNTTSFTPTGGGGGGDSWVINAEDTDVVLDVIGNYGAYIVFTPLSIFVIELLDNSTETGLQAKGMVFDRGVNKTISNGIAGSYDLDSTVTFSTLKTKMDNPSTSTLTAKHNLFNPLEVAPLVSATTRLNQIVVKNAGPYSRTAMMNVYVNVNEAGLLVLSVTTSGSIGGGTNGYSGLYISNNIVYKVHLTGATSSSTITNLINTKKVYTGQTSTLTITSTAMGSSDSVTILHTDGTTTTITGSNIKGTFEDVYSFRIQAGTTNISASSKIRGTEPNLIDAATGELVQISSMILEGNEYIMQGDNTLTITGTN